MNDLTEFFIDLLNAHKTLDIAESEFRRLLADDDELRNDYKEWCQTEGLSERTAFSDYCREYLADQMEVWNTLTDYDNE